MDHGDKLRGIRRALDHSWQTPREIAAKANATIPYVSNTLSRLADKGAALKRNNVVTHGYEYRRSASQ